MLEWINLKHFELFMVLGLIGLITLIGIYYFVIIQQGAQYTQDEYECGRTYSVATYSDSIDNTTDAGDRIHTYLQEHNITVPRESLNVIQISGTYKVELPQSLYTNRHCTYRKAGIEPPACIGRWFTLTNNTVLMEYGYPC